MNVNQQIEAIIQYYKNKQFNQMKKAIALLEKEASVENNVEALCVTSFYYAKYLQCQKNYEDSIRYFNNALQFSKQANLQYYRLKSNYELGLNYVELADYFSALKHYLKAYRIASKHNSFHYKHIILYGIGRLFIWLDEYATATYYLNEAYEAYNDQNINDTQTLVEILLSLCEANTYFGDNGRFVYLYQIHKDIFSTRDNMIISALALLKDIRIKMLLHDVEFIKKGIHTFISYNKQVKHSLYLFRGIIELLEISIKIENKECAKFILKCVDDLQFPKKAFAFDYRASKLYVDYCRKFHVNDFSKQIQAYDYFYEVSIAYALQFRKTYVQNVLVSLEVDRFKIERNYANRKNEHLLKEMEKDVFTGLLNKVYAKKYVNNLLINYEKGKKHALVLLDIDKFKDVNDEYGHQFGDEIILRTAHLIQIFVAKENIIARFGGDEFFVFFSNVKNVKEVERNVRKLLQVGKKILFPDNLDKCQTYSIGVAYIDTEMTFDEAFTIADKALYEVKNNGRNQAIIRNQSKQIAHVSGI